MGDCPCLPWPCWAVLHSGPHASPASSPICQAQVQQNRQANLPQPSSAYSHSPGGAPPPQYLMVSGKCLCPHCSPHLMAWPCQPFCIPLTPPAFGRWMQGSWKGDAQLFSFGCSICMCSASPSLRSSAHLGWGEQELVVPWFFLHIAMLNTPEPV
jgi:hypothetical protein